MPIVVNVPGKGVVHLQINPIETSLRLQSDGTSEIFLRISGSDCATLSTSLLRLGDFQQAHRERFLHIGRDLPIVNEMPEREDEEEAQEVHEAMVVGTKLLWRQMPRFPRQDK